MLTGMATTFAFSACSEPRSASDAATHTAAANVTPADMPKRPLGRTGVSVSQIGIGGYHIGDAGDKDGQRIIRSAIDRGITFLDNSWDYHDGKSEEIMGRALRDGYRQKIFLMTKLDGRTKAAAQGQLEQSLKRLQTDTIDLVQIHEVIRPGDPAACFQEGGCIEALMEAKKAGKIRFIGFTGHKDPEIHYAMLDEADKHGFRFDTVQMPLNVMDAHFRSFEKKVLPRLVQNQIGVLGMKPIGAGKILKSNTVSAVECLQYALSLPTSVVITGCDSMKVLDQAIEVATTFKPLAPEAMQALLAKTAPAAAEGKFETFKTSDEHDSTAKNPKWLSKAEI